MNLPKKFTSYLVDCRLSRKTIRNYSSDLSHFLGWATLTLTTHGAQIAQESDILNYLSPQLTESYKNFLVANIIPARTINRRLSTLRKFGQFLTQDGILLVSPFYQAENIQINTGIEEQLALLADFRQHLETENVKNKTVHNYISDVRGFMKFASGEQIRG